MLWLVRFCHRGPGCHAHINFSSLRGKKTIRCLETHFTISHLTQFWTYHRGNCLRKGERQSHYSQTSRKSSRFKNISIMSEMRMLNNSLIQWFLTVGLWPTMQGKTLRITKCNKPHNIHKNKWNFLREEKMLPIYFTFDIEGHVSNPINQSTFWHKFICQLFDARQIKDMPSSLKTIFKKPINTNVNKINS